MKRSGFNTPTQNLKPTNLGIVVLRNNCNNFSVDGGIPEKMDGTLHHAHSA